VLDNDFRHPAVVAKEAATVDVLTGGRLELGLGAGWMMVDYDSTGIPFAPASERYQRMKEVTAIVKGYFESADKLTYEGKLYQIKDLDTSPRPAQSPHPPILIGGRQKSMLSLAAREADIVGLSLLDPRAPGLPPPPTFAQKVAWVREAAGDRFDELQLHVNASLVQVADQPSETEIERVAARTRQTREQVLASPGTLVGPVEAVVETLLARREEFGVSYYVVQGRVMESFAPVIARLRG